MKQKSSFTIFLVCLIIFFGGIVCLRSVFSPPLTPHQLSQRSVARVSPSVVMIVSEKGVIGTGTLIDSRNLLTAKHLLQPGLRYGIRFQDKTIEWATLRASHPRSDLALMKLETPHEAEYPHFVVSLENIIPGTPVIAFGAIVDEPSFSTHSGILSQINQTLQIGQESFSGLFMTDIPFRAGYSGGPLVNLHGEIIGVHTAYDGSGKSGWSTPVDEGVIRELRLINAE